MGPPRLRVVIGDARRMSRVDDASVHLVVTSPPYWQLKDYGDPRQIGFHDTFDEYVRGLDRVWGECARALHPGCRMAVNVGDQFARASVYGRYRVIPIREAIGRRMAELGLDPLGAIIWQKVTTCNTTGGGVVMGSFPYPRNGILKLDYEFILIYKKPGDPPAVSREAKEAARLTTEEWNRFFYGHWTFPGARQEDHIAVFPPELPRRLIRMFTFPGETVLDPFLGSGTTLASARDLGRAGVGYEINREYLPAIEEKLGRGPQRDLLAGADEVEVVVEPEEAVDAPAPARPAPGGPAGGDGRTGDPAGYGSVVRRGDRRGREDYRRVEEVRDVRTVVLDSGETVSLLGVAPNARSAVDGVRYLEGLLRRERVYLRRDPRAGAGEVYLYLKNRTFVNARLIREGMAGVDGTRDYRLRGRLERLAAAAGGGEKGSP